MSFPAAILKSHAVRVAVAAATLVAGSAQAATGGKTGLTIEMRGQVGVVCKLNFASTTVPPSANGQVDFGMVQEFCNAANGYRIYLNFDPTTLAGAQLQLGSDTVQLGNSGMEMVSSYDSANLRARPMTMSLARPLSGPAAIALRIEAAI